MIEIFQYVQDWFVQIFGSYLLVALMFFCFFIVVFLVAGLDFKNTLYISSLSLAPALGWIPDWLRVIVYIVVIGFGLWGITNQLRGY